MAAAILPATMTTGLADGPSIMTGRGWNVVAASTLGPTFPLGSGASLFAADAGLVVLPALAMPKPPKFKRHG